MLVVQARSAQVSEAPSGPSAEVAVETWLRSQRVNFAAALGSLQPFPAGVFGSGPEAPLPDQLAAANALIARLGQRLQRIAEVLQRAGGRARSLDADARLDRFQQLKARGEQALGAVEKVWDFYFELFNQRHSPLGEKLMAADRIGTDCYQAVYMNLGAARSIPAPRPWAYVDTGFGPATFRRGVRLTALGRNANPFPLLVFPRSRLVAPWTLGALPHEVGHNIQADLGLWTKIERAIEARLRAERLPPLVVDCFTRWHKETFADLIGVLLIGPAYVGSLMDVVGGRRANVALYQPQAVHPTPLLRVPLNLALLRRMGFSGPAGTLRAAWDRLYPRSLWRQLPLPLAQSFDRAAEAVIETICFTAYPELGGKSLAEVTRFTPRHQALVDEGAARLAQNANTGILPSRYLIAAARTAFDRRMAPPEQITRNFYQALVRR